LFSEGKYDCPCRSRRFDLLKFLKTLSLFLGTSTVSTLLIVFFHPDGHRYGVNYGI